MSVDGAFDTRWTLDFVKKAPPIGRVEVLDTRQRPFVLRMPPRHRAADVLRKPRVSVEPKGKMRVCKVIRIVHVACSMGGRCCLFVWLYATMPCMNDDQMRHRWWQVVATLWMTQLAVMVSGNALNFALIWQLSATTQSAQALALAAALSLVPGIVVTPIAGMLSDRQSRRQLMIMAEVAASLPLLAVWLWPATVPIWAIYVVVVWRAAATAIHYTAFQSLLPQLIPARHFQRLSGMPQFVHGFASLLTPVLGALIVATWGVTWAAGVALLMLGLSLGVLLLVPIPTGTPATVVTRWQDDWRALQRVVPQRHGLWQLLWAAVILNVCLLPIFSMLPHMVTTYFQQGPWLLVWLELAGGAGLLLGAVALASWGGFAHVPHTLVVAVVLLIVAMIIVALTPPSWPWSMIAALVLIGWAAAWAHGPLLTLVQANVPVSMHGRALAVLTTAMNAAAPLGIALAGVVVDASGVSLWAAMVALGAIGVLWWAVRGPIMTLRSTPLPSIAQHTDLTFDV